MTDKVSYGCGPGGSCTKVKNFEDDKTSGKGLKKREFYIVLVSFVSQFFQPM